MTTIEKRVYERVLRFMLENDISCSETIYQTDRVIENAYEFIDDLYELVRENLPQEDENDNS